MAFVWRLVDPRYADDLEGSGNRVHGARWNSPGRGVLYCSENLSLCVHETLVHSPPHMRRRLPPRLALKLKLPENATVTDIDRLPRSAIAARCRELGDRWLERAESLILRAPSIIVAQERNIMFNPAHPGMKDVQVVDKVPFSFDDRLIHI